MDLLGEPVVVVNQHQLAMSSGGRLFLVQVGFEVLHQSRVGVHHLHGGVDIQLGQNVSQSCKQTHPGVVDEERVGVHVHHQGLHGWAYCSQVTYEAGLSLVQSQFGGGCTSGGLEEVILVVQRNGGTDLQWSHPDSLHGPRWHLFHEPETVVTDESILPAGSTGEVRVGLIIVIRFEVVEAVDGVRVFSGSGCDHPEA